MGGRYTRPIKERTIAITDNANKQNSIVHPVPLLLKELKYLENRRNSITEKIKNQLSEIEFSSSPPLEEYLGPTEFKKLQEYHNQITPLPPLPQSLSNILNYSGLITDTYEPMSHQRQNMQNFGKNSVASAPPESDFPRENTESIEEPEKYVKQLEKKKEPVESALVEKKKEPDEDNCVVCMENVPTMVIVPCGHMVLCEGCSGQIKSQGNCPICRGHIREIIKTFRA